MQVIFGGADSAVVLLYTIKKIIFEVPNVSCLNDLGVVSWYVVPKYCILVTTLILTYEPFLNGPKESGTWLTP